MVTPSGVDHAVVNDDIDTAKDYLSKAVIQLESSVKSIKLTRRKCSRIC